MVLSKLQLSLLAFFVFLLTFGITSHFFKEERSDAAIPVAEMQRLNQLAEEIDAALSAPGEDRENLVHAIIQQSNHPVHLSYLDWKVKFSATAIESDSSKVFFTHLPQSEFQIQVPVGKPRVRGILTATGRLQESVVTSHWMVTHVLVSLAVSALIVALFLWLKAQRVIRPIDRLCQEFTRYRREQENQDLNLPSSLRGQAPIERRVAILDDLWLRFQSTQGQLSHKVSELQQSKTILEKTIDDLERAKAQERRLVELGYALAEFGHDIRNANGAILSFVTLMRQIFEKEPVRMVELARCPLYVKSIRMASETITGLTTDLLEFAKGRTDVRKDMISLEDLMIKLEANLAFAEDIPLFHDWQTVRPFSVNIDSGKIIRVIVNLIKNAWEKLINEDQEGEIHIQFSSDADAGLRICITDNGALIPDELLPLLFQSFSTRKETGTGLGLAICKKIVEAHGGWIQAENLSRSAGVRFTFYLPECVLIPMEQPARALA